MKDIILDKLIQSSVTQAFFINPRLKEYSTSQIAKYFTQQNNVITFA